MEHVQCIVTVQAQKTWESERGSYVSVVPALMEMWSSGSGHAAPRSSSYTCEKCMMLWGFQEGSLGFTVVIVYLRLERYEIKENNSHDNNKMNI